MTQKVVDVLDDVVFQLYKKASTTLPDDMLAGFENALQREENDIARAHLKALLENSKVAKEVCAPVCSDTGIPTIFLSLGKEFNMELVLSAIDGSIQRGVARATAEGYLRPTAVDPFDRFNPSNNCGPHIPVIDVRWGFDFEGLEITAISTGGGGLAPSVFKLFTVSEGWPALKEFVLDWTVQNSMRGVICPPTILGIGVAGTADLAIRLAKRSAVLREVGKRHAEERVAVLEQEMEGLLNKTGVGLMGMGGNNTVFAVHMDYSYVHLAMLPVALNYQCGANRRAVARISPAGEVKYLDLPTL